MKFLVDGQLPPTLCLRLQERERGCRLIGLCV